MRNFANVKNVLNQKQLSAIILCAGEGRRMKSYGNKSLIKVNGNNLIHYQIQAIKEKFPDIHEIIVVVGYEADKVIKQLPQQIKIVENEKYDQNSSSRSLNMGLRICLSSNILVVHGDILFDKSCLDFSTYSAITVDNHKRIRDTKVGLTKDGDKNLIALDYGLQNKWSQIAFFTGKELELLRKTIKERNKDSLCTFEIINHIVNKGGKFRCIDLDAKSTIKEFDSISEINNFNSLEEESI